MASLGEVGDSVGLALTPGVGASDEDDIGTSVVKNEVSVQLASHRDRTDRQ